jgi:hypothetical protein
VSPLQIALTVIGLYLIFEGIGSFILFADQDPLLEAGRVLRVFFGLFIIYYAVKVKS